MKNKRQEKLLELINEKMIITQEDLQTELETLGFEVTQSTVSRDIKALRIVKGHDQNGRYRYISAEQSGASAQPENHYRDLFASAVKSIAFSFNNVVVKCRGGMASSACVAMDALFGDQMLGSLAGEDTIIAVTKGERESGDLVSALKKLL